MKGFTMNGIISGLGFTESYLRQKWDSSTFEEFLKFMRGQTVSMADNEYVYYFIDVQNFCSRFGVDWPNKK